MRLASLLTAPIAGLLAGIALAGGAQAQSQPAPIELAPNPFAQHCTAGRADAVVLLVDQTEAYDSVDRNRLAEGAIRLLEGLRYGQRLAIYPLDDTPGDLRATLDLCTPGCPESYDPETDGSIWGHTCERIVVQRQKQQFLQIFRARMADLLNGGRAADGTELLRTLSTLSNEFENAPPERLIIFSDMIEYSTLNRKVNSFDAAAAQTLLRRAAERAPQSGAFEGVPVQAFGFGKRLGQQRLVEERGAFAELPFDATQALREFWETYFAEQMKAGSVRIQLNYGD